MTHRPLNEQDLALLESKLMLPFIVGQMINGLEPFDQIAEFTLHDIISQMEPDTAFLCIALCASRIAYFHKQLPIAAVMGIEAENMVDDYAPLWLAHARGEDVDIDEARALLENLPEDFESLEVLLRTTQISFANEENVTAILCNVLAIQAESFKAYTENYFGIESEPDENALSSFTYGDNVIVFPQAASKIKH